MERRSEQVRPAPVTAGEAPSQPEIIDDQTAPRRHPLWKYGVVLGLLTASGAFGIDTYLPAFPKISEALGVDEGRVQLSLTSYMAALTVGQVIYGPVSDKVGRKGPLLFGFALFVVGSIGCALSPGIWTLIAMRFVQGLGACAGMVLGRAVIRDLSTGEAAAKLFALLILLLGVSPIVAPMLGSTLIWLFPWQSIFWAIAIIGVACLVLIVTFLDETNPASRRPADAGFGKPFAAYGTLLRDRTFLTTALIGGCSQGAVFAYLAGSSFVYIDLHGVSEVGYSLLFALNASALIGAAQCNVKLMRWLGASKLVFSAALVQTIAAASIVALALAGLDSLVVIAASLFVVLGCHGILGPTTSLLAIEPWPQSAGAASAMMGALQFAVGTVASAVVSVLANGTSVPMFGVIAACAAGSLALWFVTLRPSADTPEAAVPAAA